MKILKLDNYHRCTYYAVIVFIKSRLFSIPITSFTVLSMEAVFLQGPPGESLPKVIDTGFYWYDKTHIEDLMSQLVFYK